MKNVIVLFVFGCAFLATPFINAQTTSEPVAVVKEEVTYAEIEVSDLPEVVTLAVEKEFAGAKITKAFKGSDKSFKVEILLNTIASTLIVAEDSTITVVEK